MTILEKTTYDKKETFLISKGFEIQEHHGELALDEMITSNNLLESFKNFNIIKKTIQ